MTLAFDRAPYVTPARRGADVRTSTPGRLLPVAGIIPADLGERPAAEIRLLLSRQSWLTGRPAQHWQYVARRLDQHTGNAALRNRAAGVVGVFTGSAVGVLAGLLYQEQEQQRAQLRAAAAVAWAQLRADSDAAPEFIADRATAVARADAALREWDLLERAAAAGPALSQSIGAALRLAESRPRRLASLLPGGGRAAGFGYLPLRRSFVAWMADGPAVHVLEINAGAMADWVRSLGTDDPTVLDWTRSTMPVSLAGLSTDQRRLALEIAELRQLRVTADTGADRRPTRRNDHLKATHPGHATTLLITAAESTAGLEPIDLATGEAPTITWRKARWRRIWSADHSRSVRTWTDAAQPADRGAPGHRTEIALLPGVGAARTPTQPTRRGWAQAG